VWTSKTAALLWKSGVSETISRWACRCDPASSLKKMAKTLPVRYLTIGWPPIAAPSAPKRDVIGILSEAQAKYGQPASVEVVRAASTSPSTSTARGCQPDRRRPATGRYCGLRWPSDSATDADAVRPRRHDPVAGLNPTHDGVSLFYGSGVPTSISSRADALPTSL
jgi:hypothetical protein